MRTWGNSENMMANLCRICYAHCGTKYVYSSSGRISALIDVIVTCEQKHHFQDIPDNVKRHLGSMPDGYLAYFTRRFPRLFLHVHTVIRTSGLRSESMFRSYFQLPD